MQWLRLQLISKMKVGAALLTQVILTLGPLASAQKIPEECFGYSAPKGNGKKGKSINNESQVLSTEFSHDMRLKKIITCKGFSDELLGITFVLRTTTKSPPIDLELESLGYRFGNSCSTTVLKPNESVSYVEISYNSDKVNSFYAKIGENTNILVGNRQAFDQSKGWSFNEKNLLMGLIGTESSDGINSLGTLIYQPACADQALGFNVDPTTGSKNFVSGLLERNEQGPDGTYRFADTPMRFENKNLAPRMDASGSMWSFSNPDLAEDVKDWAVEAPTVYYVGSGLLLVAISIISCICCCCQACYTPNVTKILDDPQSNGASQSIQLSSKKFKVQDVLNEQATCEDIAETQPTQRRLVSLTDTEVNEKIPVAVSSIAAEQLQEERERELKSVKEENRRSLAEQIMYGSVLSRKDTLPDEMAISEHQTQDDRLVASIEDRRRRFLDMTPPDTRDSARVQDSQFNSQRNAPMAMHLLNRGQSNPQSVGQKMPSSFNIDDGNYDHWNNQKQNPNIQQLNVGNQQFSQPPQHTNPGPYGGQPAQQQPDQTFFNNQFQQRMGLESERLRVPNRRPTATYSSQSVTYASANQLQNNVVDPFIQDQYQQQASQQQQLNTSQQILASNPYQHDGYIGNSELNQFISFQQAPGHQAPQPLHQRNTVQRHATQDDVHNSTRKQQQYGVAPMQQHQNQYLQRDEYQSNMSHQKPLHQQPQYTEQYSALQSRVSPEKSQFQQQHQEIQQFTSAQKVQPSYNQRSILSPPSQQLLSPPQYQHQQHQQLQHSQQDHNLHQQQQQQQPAQSLHQSLQQQTLLSPVQPQQPQRQSHYQQHAQLSIPQHDNMSSVGQSQIQITSINESSINRASYPETPNTNVVIQGATGTSVNDNRVMERLSTQVLELESQLQLMQRQQSLKDMTTEAAKQETQHQQRQQLQVGTNPSNESILQHVDTSSIGQGSLSQTMQSQQPYQQPPQPQPSQGIQNKQEPIVVNIRPRVEQQQQQQPADTNMRNFQLPLDNPTPKGRNNMAINNHQTGAPSTYIMTERITQADIDDQFKDIPEIGGISGKNSNIQVDDMFNYGKKFEGSQMSQIPSQNTASNTFKQSMNSQMLHKGSIGSSVQNMSAILANNEGQPERTSGVGITSSSVIELNSVAEAGPVSKPQRSTPSPTYFTK